MFENKERSGAKMGWVWGCQELVNFLVPCLSYLKVWGGGGGEGSKSRTLTTYFCQPENLQHK